MRPEKKKKTTSKAGTLPFNKRHENQIILDAAMHEAGIANTYELATRSGVSPSILYKFRKGRTSRFYGETQIRLAAVLPNLFGQPTPSPTEMKAKVSTFKAALERTLAKRQAVATKSKPAASRAKKTTKKATAKKTTRRGY
jgi:hypothetical protein